MRKGCQLAEQGVDPTKKGAVEAFRASFGDTCPSQLKGFETAVCDQAWAKARIAPKYANSGKIQAFLQTCEGYSPANRAYVDAMAAEEERLCGVASKSKGGLQQIKSQLERFEGVAGRKAHCLGKVESAMGDFDSNARSAAIRARFRPGAVVSFETTTTFETDDCFTLLTRVCHTVSYPTKIKGKVVHADKDEVVVRIISASVSLRAMESIAGLQNIDDAKRTARGWTGDERSYSWSDIH